MVKSRAKCKQMLFNMSFFSSLILAASSEPPQSGHIGLHSRWDLFIKLYISMEAPRAFLPSKRRWKEGNAYSAAKWWQIFNKYLKCSRNKEDKEVSGGPRDVIRTDRMGPSKGLGWLPWNIYHLGRQGKMRSVFCVEYVHSGRNKSPYFYLGLKPCHLALG